MPGARRPPRGYRRAVQRARHAVASEGHAGAGSGAAAHDFGLIRTEPARPLDPLARLHPRVPGARRCRSPPACTAGWSTPGTGEAAARPAIPSSTSSFIWSSRWRTPPRSSSARDAADRAAERRALPAVSAAARRRDGARPQADAGHRARPRESTAPETPALIASLVLLRKSYAATARDAALVFQAAAAGPDRRGRRAAGAVRSGSATGTRWRVC